MKEEFWSGSFGNEYTARNRVDWRKRIPFWNQIIGSTNVRSVYEFGCNAGWNLSAIREKHMVSVYGNDINEIAVWQAIYSGLSVEWADKIKKPANSIELVFTAGVLIHIDPDSLYSVMKSIVDTSCDYVLAVEYGSEKEEEVEYRGHKGRLWKRPYGRLYQEFGLDLVQYGHAGEGFDNCMYWLLRKGERNAVV